MFLTPEFIRSKTMLEFIVIALFLRKQKRTKQANKNFVASNPDYHKQWRERNPGYFGRYFSKRRKVDSAFKLRCDLAVWLCMRLKAKKPKGGKAPEIIGCTIAELKVHLASLFVPPMAWENYGSVWEIDHKIPASKFDHSNPNEVKKCWHFTNLQPLLTKDNLHKSSTC